MVRTAKVAVLLAVTVAALAIAAPQTPASAAPPANGWVGQVAGSPAFVGLVARGQDVTAYVCDGRGVGRWYAGRLAGTRAVLRDERGRRLVVHVAGRTASGVVDLPGRRAARFTARAARGRAGVFRRERAFPAVLGKPARQTVEGWVRLNDGRVRGLARTETIGIRTPAARFEVLFRPRPPQTTIGPPGSGPPGGARLIALSPSDPCAPVPRPARGGRRPRPFTAGPTCGLPAAGMTLGVRRDTSRLSSRPAGLRLSNAAVDRLLADLPRLRELEEARVLQATGLPRLPPSFPPPPAVRRLGALAEAMIRDRELTAAATRLRLARTVEERSARLAAYRGLGGRFVDPGVGLVRRDEIGLRQLGAVGTVSFTQEVTVPGSYLVFGDTRLEGPDAEVTESQHVLNFADTREKIGGLARAGFFSRAEFDEYAVIGIDVPPGAREVEIDADPGTLVDFDTQLSCMAGGGWAYTGVVVTVHAMNADGTFHVLDDPPVDGYSDWRFDDAGIPLPFGICPIFAPPVPDPPPLNVVSQPLRITDPPPGGGRFMVTVAAYASAYTVGDGKASADLELSLFDVKVRSRF